MSRYYELLKAGIVLPAASTSVIPPSQAAATQIRAMAASLPHGDEVGTAVKATGGTIPAPLGDIDLGTIPLYVGGPQELAGLGRAGTRFVYHGTGHAIRIRTFADHEYACKTVIRDLSIYAPNGDGIGFDPQTTHGEANSILVENVVVNCKGIGIDLVNPHGNMLYRGIVRNCEVSACGTAALRLRGSICEVSGFMCVAGAMTSLSGRALVDLEGSGSYCGWHEVNTGGKPMLRAKGDWNYTTGPQHWEPHFEGITTILDGWGISQRFPGTHTVLVPQFLMPKVPWALQGGASLDVLGHDHGASSSDGGHGYPESCFRLAAGSSVYVAGKKILPQ